MDGRAHEDLFKSCCTTSSGKIATVSSCARSCTMREKLSAKKREFPFLDAGFSARWSHSRSGSLTSPTRCGTQQHHIEFRSGTETSAGFPFRESWSRCFQALALQHALQLLFSAIHPMGAARASVTASNLSLEMLSHGL